MKSIGIVVAIVLSSAIVANADLGWFDDFVTFDVKGSSETYEVGGSATYPAFDGHDFGSFSLTDTFLWTGVDASYWSDTQDRGGGAVNIQVDSAGFNEHIWSQEGPAGVSGNDYTGTLTGQSYDILTGLSAGSHTLSIYMKSWDSGGGQGDSYLSNGGANYVANFNVVPEPASMGLFGLGLGLLALVRRRRR